MNIASAIQFALTLILFSLPTAQALTVTAPPAGDLHVVKGTVQIAEGKMAPHAAAKTEAVFSNSQISTGLDSAALLKFSDGQTVNLLADSALLIRSFKYSPDASKNSFIVLSMIKGSMRFVTGNIGLQNKQAFRLSAPNATIGINGTDFMLAMRGKNMYGHVQSGSITMTNATGVLKVDAGQNALVASATSSITLVAASAVPSGIFSELLAMPVDPAAIATRVAAKEVVPAVEATKPAVESAVVLPSETLSAPIPLASLTIAEPVAADTVAKPQDAAPPVSPAIVVAEEKPAPIPEPEKLPIVEKIPEAPASDARHKEPEGFASGKFGTGIAGKIGTLGYGAELAASISDNLVTARFGVNTLNYNYNTNSSAINYDFKLQLQTASALLDIYPFKGQFRTTIGIMYNNNSLELIAKPTGASYTINGQIYPTSEIDSVHGSIEFTKTAPYLGIGWGNPVAKGKGWGMVTDVGILFQGSPKSRLTAHCAASATVCTPSSIQVDVDAENAKLQNDLRNFKYWPVASIGISYQW